MFRSKGVVTAFAFLSLFAFTVAGCGGGDDGASEEQLQQAREDGAKDAEAQAKLEQLQETVDQLSKEQRAAIADGQAKDDAQDNSSSVAPDATAAGFTDCMDGVWAGPKTSCSFAMNVAGEYGSNPGASSISAFSPVTDKEYTMFCTPSGAGTMCSGGNGATVFIP